MRIQNLPQLSTRSGPHIYSIIATSLGTKHLSEILGFACLIEMKWDRSWSREPRFRDIFPKFRVILDQNLFSSLFDKDTRSAILTYIIGLVLVASVCVCLCELPVCSMF